MIAVPQAPSAGADVAFQAPPGWTVPAGFDPRRGHLVDPAWPAAPDGWQWWAPAPRPRGFGAWVRRAGWGPLLLGSLLIGFFLILAFDESSPVDGVGSCWTSAGQTDGSFVPVDCTDTSAEVVVDSVVTSPDQCPFTEMYFEVGSSSYQCLRLAS